MTVISFPVPVNFRMRELRAAVAFGDEDIAVRRRDDVVRLVEVVGSRGASRFAERHQQLAVRAELEDLMSPRRTGRRSQPIGVRRRSQSVAPVHCPGRR